MFYTPPAISDNLAQQVADLPLAADAEAAVQGVADLRRLLLLEALWPRRRQPLMQEEQAKRDFPPAKKVKSRFDTDQ